jgi:hypothetical protein
MKLVDGREFDPYHPEAAEFNLYVCEGVDRHANLSADLEKGVTPFMTTCTGCMAMAVSSMYRIPGNYEAFLPVVMVWRKPVQSEIKKAKRQGYGDHYEQGGLAKELTGEKPRLRMVTARFA